MTHSTSVSWVATRARVIERKKVAYGSSHPMSIPDRLDRLPFASFHWLLALVMFVAAAFDNMDEIILAFAIPALRQEWALDALPARLLETRGKGLEVI